MLCVTAAAGCGGGGAKTISTATLSAPLPSPPEERRPAEPASDLLHELMADLQVTTAEPNPGAIAQALTKAFPGTQVSAGDVDGAVRKTCSKGTAAPLRSFIRDGLPRAEVGAAGVLDQVVTLIDARCPLIPGQYLQLQSVVLVELARNGMRSATSAAIRESQLNDEACGVFRTAAAYGTKIADGLTALAARHQLGERRALDVGVKAVVQACPFFLADFRGAVGELRRA